MYKIRFTPYRKELGTIMSRQTKGHGLISLDGRYQFILDDSCESPDFWVVQGKGVREPQTCHVAPANTIMLTTEPRSVLVYPDKYLRQFGMVCTCQPQTHHPRVHFGPAILPWFVGYTEDAEGHCHYSLDYDRLIQPSDAAEKTRLISVITSNKAFTRGHLDRIRFVEQLKAHYGDRLDVFGRGFFGAVVHFPYFEVRVFFSQDIGNPEASYIVRKGTCSHQSKPILFPYMIKFNSSTHKQQVNKRKRYKNIC